MFSPASTLMWHQRRPFFCLCRGEDPSKAIEVGVAAWLALHAVCFAVSRVRLSETAGDLR